MDPVRSGKDHVLTTATADDVATAVPRKDDNVVATTKPDPISPTTGFRVIGPAARVQKIPASRTEERQDPGRRGFVVSRDRRRGRPHHAAKDHVVASTAVNLVIPARPDKAIVAAVSRRSLPPQHQSSCRRPSHTQARDSRRTQINFRFISTLLWSSSHAWPKPL